MEFDPQRAETLRSYRQKIGVATEDKNEAVGTLGAIYKDLDDKGFHKAAVKHAHKLSKLEAPSFRVYYDALNEALHAFGCFDQKDLFLDGKATEVKAAPINAETKDPELHKEPEKPKPEKASAKTKPAKPEKDDFGTAGAKERGVQAGLNGKDKDANPCPAGSLDAQQWDAGWTEGRQKLVDAAALADGQNQRPARRRGFTEDGTTVPPAATAETVPAAEMVH